MLKKYRAVSWQVKIEKASDEVERRSKQGGRRNTGELCGRFWGRVWIGSLEEKVKLRI